MMLEDDIGDVLRKSLAGHGLTAAEAAERAGVSAEQWAGLLDGRIEAAVVKKVAGVLGLHAGALCRLNGYRPRPLDRPDVHRLELPFGDWGVNAWWIEVTGKRVLVDSGCDRESLSRALGPRLPDQVWITHGHRDHIGGLQWLLERGVPCYGWGLNGVCPMEPCEEREVDGVRVRLHDLSGHFIPAFGIGFLDSERPLLAVGDALFAGSMGKCGSPEVYAMALENLRRACSRLPDEITLLPGHGPATTLGEERQSNPFLADG